MFVPNTRVSLLSSPSKMPSKSWGLPAIKACPSATFGVGAICGEAKEKPTCYAMHGAYVWAPVRNAYETRYKWAIRASMDAATGDEFVATLTEAIAKEALRQERKHYREISKGEREYTMFSYPVFRVHDSGDLFSPSYTLLWARICAALPDVDFWFPTRQHKSRNLHMQASLLALSSLPNVALRPSALFINDAPPVIPGFAAGTSVMAEGYNCPAPQQKNACNDCRMCWTKDTAVVYRLH